MEGRNFRVTCSLLLVILILSCSITSVDCNLIDDHFKATPCTSPNVQTILKMIPAKTTRALSNLHCAIFCHRTQLCKYAIFNKIPKTCEHVYGLTNTFRPIDQEYLLTDEETGEANNCSVLTRVVTNPWTKIADKKLSLLWNHDYFGVMKLSIDTRNYQVFPVSQVIVNASGDFIMATDGHVAGVAFPKSNNAKFSTAYRNRLVYIYNDDLGGTSSVRGGITFSTRAASYLTKIKDSTFIFLRHIKLESQVKLEDNIEDAMISILTNGYRMLDSHPTRIQFDPQTTEAHLDVTQTVFVQDPGTQPQTPYYFQSTKETFTTDRSQSTRYTLKHQMFEGLEQTMEEETVLEPYPWVLELSWKPEPDPTQLYSGIRSGKPIRVMLEDNTITDTTAVYLNAGNIMVATAPYIYPMRGRDSKMTTSHYIRFPVLQETEGQMVECESHSIRGDYPYTAFKATGAILGYYSSTKTWTQVLAIGRGQTILAGSNQDLKQSVTEGKNIRVCLDDVSRFLFFCINTQYVTSTMEGDSVTILQSVPFMEPTEVFGNGIQCPKLKIFLFSTKGVVQKIDFDLGLGDRESYTVDFDEMIWFAEQD